MTDVHCKQFASLLLSLSCCPVTNDHISSKTLRGSLQ